MRKFVKYFFITLTLLLVVLATSFLITSKQDKEYVQMGVYNDLFAGEGGVKLLPSTFINGERFYIKMVTKTGDTALAFGDSGGGISMLQPMAVDKFKLKSEIRMAFIKGFVPFRFIYFSDVLSNVMLAGGMPSPRPSNSFILHYPFHIVTVPSLVIPPLDDEMKYAVASMPFDIFLGENFFMGHSWTFDYPHRQVLMNTPLKPTDIDSTGVQKIGFKKMNNGGNMFGHGRIYIIVDGELIEVLFDTGASIILSEAGKQALHTKEKTIGGSFIAASIFDRWRVKHPDWKYYPKADDKRDVIEVPLIKVGGYEVGPVLFSRRPDEVWSQGMVQTMDNVVKGAIGGSALKYFKVTVDYNNDLIRFVR